MSERPRKRPVAWSLATPRLRLRVYHPRDAPAFVEAVESCREVLARTMPFALEPATVDTYVPLFEGFQHRAHQRDYLFGLWHPTADGEVAVGGCGLHPTVGTLGREAGYWIVQDYWGQGFATEALAALGALAFHLERVDRVELRIEPSNTASQQVAARSGYTREALLKRRFAMGDEVRDVEVHTLFASDWPHSPGAAVPVRAFDSADRPVPWPPLTEADPWV